MNVAAMKKSGSKYSEKKQEYEKKHIIKRERKESMDQILIELFFKRRKWR